MNTRKIQSQPVSYRDSIPTTRKEKLGSSQDLKENSSGSGYFVFFGRHRSMFQRDKLTNNRIKVIRGFSGTCTSHVSALHSFKGSESTKISYVMAIPSTFFNGGNYQETEFSRSKHSLSCITAQLYISYVLPGMKSSGVSTPLPSSPP